jgi:hypothetical protein
MKRKITIDQKMAIFLTSAGSFPNAAEFLLIYLDRITIFDISQRRFCNTADYITLVVDRKVKGSGRAFYIELTFRI